MLKVVEGVEGYWHYHLSETGISGRPALCGNKRVMHTEIPLSTWGTKSHLNEKYCSECEKKAGIGCHSNIKSKD